MLNDDFAIGDRVRYATSNQLATVKRLGCGGEVTIMVDGAWVPLTTYKRLLDRVVSTSHF